MLNVKIIVARRPGKVTMETAELDENALPPDRILVKTLYRAVSAGTECAWISGNANNPGQSFPFYPGYSAAGKVVKLGSEVEVSLRLKQDSGGSPLLLREQLSGPRINAGSLKLYPMEVDPCMR